MYALMSVIAIVEFILLMVLSVRRSRKYDGRVIVLETDEKKIFSLEIKGDPDKLDQKKQIVLKVVSPPE